MNPIYAAGTCRSTVQVQPGPGIVIGLAGSPGEDAMMRYMAFWAKSQPAVNAYGQTLPFITRLLPTSAEGRDLFVAAPRGVHAVSLPEKRHAAATLLQYAEQGEVDALAVGDRTLACELIRGAPCSVWFVPEPPKSRPRRLLVPVDFSIQSADSVRVATTLARLSGARECVIAHVHFNDALLSGVWGDAAAKDKARQALDRFMKPIDTLGIKVTHCLREAADVPRAINELAKETEADLLVLASRGRSWAASLLQPTIADQAARNCHVPLLVVKHFGAARSTLGVLLERLRGPGPSLHCN